MRLYVLNEAGEPEECQSLFAWVLWFERSDEQRQLADDYVTVEGGVVVRVSTVFVGIDLGIDRFTCEPPSLWETMVFGGDWDFHCARHRSKAAALAFHRETLALVLMQRLDA